MRCLRKDGMNYMVITKAIDFLYARMESCKTMAEKEEILELILIVIVEILRYIQILIIILFFLVL